MSKVFSNPKNDELLLSSLERSTDGFIAAFKDASNVIGTSWFNCRTRWYSQTFQKKHKSRIIAMTNIPTRINRFNKINQDSPIQPPVEQPIEPQEIKASDIKPNTNNTENQLAKAKFDNSVKDVVSFLSNVHLRELEFKKQIEELTLSNSNLKREIEQLSNNYNEVIHVINEARKIAYVTPDAPKLFKITDGAVVVG